MLDKILGCDFNSIAAVEQIGGRDSNDNLGRLGAMKCIGGPGYTGVPSHKYEEFTAE